MSILARVGEDEHGSRLVQEVRAEGIAWIEDFFDKGGNTGLAVILLEGSVEKRIIVFPEANRNLLPSDLQKAFSRRHEVLLLQGEVPLETGCAAVHLMREQGIPALVDAGPAQDLPLERMQGMAVLSPDETEVRALTGIEIADLADAGKAARMPKKRSGADHIIIKLGKNGAVLLDSERALHLPAFKVSPLYPTAVGGAFIASAAVEWLRCRNILWAVEYSNVCGALTPQKLGAVAALSRCAEGEDFLSLQKK